MNNKLIAMCTSLLIFHTYVNPGTPHHTPSDQKASSLKKQSLAPEDGHQRDLLGTELWSFINPHILNPNAQAFYPRAEIAIIARGNKWAKFREKPGTTETESPSSAVTAIKLPLPHAIETWSSEDITPEKSEEAWKEHQTQTIQDERLALFPTVEETLREKQR